MASSDSGFEIVEHTADVSVRAWSPDLSGLFREMARGLFDIITDVDRVESRVVRRVELSADSPQDLLHEWLEEINTLHQLHHELYSAFELEVTENRLTGVVRGDTIDPESHDLRLEVKAVTWHDLRLERGSAGYQAQVLLDI